MVKNAFHLKETAVALYEDQKVAAMFRPLACATLDAVEITETDVILDVACGTGIVSREIHAKISPTFPIHGVDLNADMIAMARHVTHDRPGAFEWHVADIENLPLPTGQFTKVFCQQGMQYFPNEITALIEIRRVMQAGGQLITTIWGGASDFFIAMSDSVSKHVSPEVGKRFLTPFSYKNADKLTEMLGTAGFGAVTRTILMVDRTIRNPDTSIKNEILGHPAGLQVLDAGETVVQAIVQDIANACAKYQVGENLVVPQRTHMFIATAT
ncbi:MAG: class I SAM-dependent methyltransferase [Rhodobacteraceae bacterium]|nr:class I SAM-dependent methyltransferase [Paracoccaceae bacterium]